MPRFREYTPQIQAPGPVQTRNATAEDFGGGTGLQTLGAGIGQFTDAIQQRVEQSELSKVHAKYAEYAARKSSEFNELAKQGDPELLDNFMQSYDSGIEEIQAEISTPGARQYFDKVHGTHRAQFIELAANGQIEIAGANAKKEFLDAVNSGSNNVYNNPSAYQTQLAASKEFLDTLVKTKNLPREVAIQLEQMAKDQYAKGALRGWMKSNAGLAVAEKKLRDGEFDSFDEDQRNQLYGEIEATRRRRQQDYEAEQVREEKRLQKRQGELMAGAFRGFGDGSFKIEEIYDREGKYKELDFQDLNNLRNAYESYIKNGGILSKNPQIEYQVYQGIHVTHTINSAKEIRAKVGLGLDVETAEKLVKELEDRDTPQGKNLDENMKSLLLQAEIEIGTKKAGALDLNFTPPARAVNQFNLFRTAVRDAIAAAKGDAEKQRELLSPSSPKWLGRLIDNFKINAEPDISARESVRLKRDKPGGITVQEIEDLTADEIVFLDKRGLSKAQREAAARRWLKLTNPVDNPIPDLEFGPRTPENK